MADVDPLWAARWGLPDRKDPPDRDYCAAYLRAAKAAGRGSSDIFGMRLMRNHLRDLLAMIDMVFPGLPSDRARLEAAFGHSLYIHLTRDQKLAQAVSMVKAEQTGLWHMAPDGSELERLAPPQEPAYDFDRIDTTLATLERQDAAWRRWFDEQCIEPLRIEYEGLSANPADTLASICRALDVPAPAADQVRPGVARLSDATSLDWMHRYRLQAGLTGRDPKTPG